MFSVASGTSQAHDAGSTWRCEDQLSTFPQSLASTNDWQVILSLSLDGRDAEGFDGRARCVTINKTNPLFDDRGREAGDVGGDFEIARVGVTLGVEDVHAVAAADLDVQAGRLRVEVDGAGLGDVHAAEVERELAVDEDPHVVVAAEGE